MSESPDLRVIIIEDQALLAMELELVLGESGCDVVGCAMDQASAFAVAEREHPDLALIDVNLLDGIPEGFAGALGAVSKPFDEQTIRAVVDFARQFIHNRTVGEPPRRFRLAPWLTTPPSEIAPH